MKAGMAILASQKVDFGTRNLKKEQKGQFVKKTKIPCMHTVRVQIL